MWVDSLIKRTHGHMVEMDGQVYAFHPDNGYCCEVTEPAHLARFREIPEGYQVSGSVAESEPVIAAHQAPLVSGKTSQRRTRRYAPAAKPVLMPDA